MRIGALTGAALVAALTVSACSRLPLPDILGGGGPSPAALSDTTLCLLDASSARGLTSVQAKRDRETGRLYVQRGARLTELAKAYPEQRGGGYAEDEPWYQGGAAIPYRERRYRKYGSERVVPASSLVRGATFQGVRFFLDPRDAPPTSVLYVPLRPGCIFQPYLSEQELPRAP